jgi:PII-like signaling protein
MEEVIQMELFDKKRISIIVEKTYRDQVVRLLEDSGVSGFTVYKEIYGKGQHGVRSNHGELGEISGNLEIVSVTGPEVAERLLQGLSVMLSRGVIMIVHVAEVKVIRDDHFN